MKQLVDIAMEFIFMEFMKFINIKEGYIESFVDDSKIADQPKY